jgi:phosphatidate cytidylyltransferase
MNELVKRIVFGIVFLAFVFVPLYVDSQNQSHFFILTLLLFFVVGSFEFNRLASAAKSVSSKPFVSIFLGLLVFAPIVAYAIAPRFFIRLDLFFTFIEAFNRPYIIWAIISLNFIAVAVLLLLAFLGNSSNTLYKYQAITSFVYITLPLGSLAWLYTFTSTYDQNNFPYLLFLIFCSTYINDSFAYIFGRLFGKHKMFPLISPKKTWEGFIGGLLSVIVCSLLFYYSFHKLIPFTTSGIIKVILFSISISVLSTAGDLFESRLKRIASVKDSGTILPGHGGILDRIDAMLFTSILTLSFFILF